ncbi:uncharacterized protein BDR25DRAFT_337748 [Lindgomyces ingoldianus]|uniref:Uncharacterized protein n=1 Tax=Lindgomyces ingoldianus TaxID=673940 RepID=A0ACB6QAI8_9PLEO|nr:uncharacterized protein BDR25DRAFT_337748 [Lindgomyces ingoldianus]KAF2463598.1 hypothetical protein BDR25DRAFT_337748 [Lindgomyces ingoldianus]
MTAVSRSLFRVAILSFLITRPSLPKDYLDVLSLTEDQCKIAFPGLIDELHDAVLRGTFTFNKSNPDYKGLIQGRIKDGKLYILTSSPDTLPEILHQRTAILQQLHRAIVTSTTVIPDTHFAFVINDNPKDNSWSFAHPNKPNTDNTWLMPHFSFWSWPSPFLGTMDDALSRISHIESSTPFPSKIDKAVWRGTIWFNPIGNPYLRSKLITTTTGKHWANIQKLEKDRDGEITNSLNIEEFCKYKYVVYTEGVTYSGRLAYHQACESVLLMPPLTYLTHTARWIKPVVAEEMMGTFGKTPGSDESEKVNKTTKGWSPPTILPTVKDWREANAVYVAKDWSDLESTIDFLRTHPKIAETIASNQRKMTHGKGYLSSAAETCYWRALVKGWASVAVPDGEWGDELDKHILLEAWYILVFGHLSIVIDVETAVDCNNPVDFPPHFASAICILRLFTLIDLNYDITSWIKRRQQ